MTCKSSLRIFLLGLSCISLSRISAQSQWVQREYHPTPLVLKDSAVTPSHSATAFTERLTVEARGAMSGIGERSGPAPAYWGYNLIADGDTLTVSIRHGNTNFGDILDSRYTRVQAVRGATSLFSCDYTDGFATSSGAYNTLQLEIDKADGKLRLSGGSHTANPIFELPFEVGDLSNMLLEVWAKGELRLSSLSTEVHHSADARLATPWTVESLNEVFVETSDPLEGYWRYLDRKNDPDYARLGGRYVLAVVRSKTVSGGYDIIYISGAETLASRWNMGVTKGHLLPTIFQSHYNLQWYDSTFEPITHDIHASVADNAILTLSFPLLNTTLRFSKAPYHKEGQAD